MASPTLVAHAPLHVVDPAGAATGTLRFSTPPLVGNELCAYRLCGEALIKLGEAQIAFHAQFSGKNRRRWHHLLENDSDITKSQCDAELWGFPQELHYICTSHDISAKRSPALKDGVCLRSLDLLSMVVGRGDLHTKLHKPGGSVELGLGRMPPQADIRQRGLSVDESFAFSLSQPLRLSSTFSPLALWQYSCSAK